MCPPRIRFLTRIYHPNIDRLGRICLDVLKNNWSPALQIRTILLSIQALLGAPNPEDPLNEAVAKQWKVGLCSAYMCGVDADGDLRRISQRRSRQRENGHSCMLSQRSEQSNELKLLSGRLEMAQARLHGSAGSKDRQHGTGCSQDTTAMQLMIAQYNGLSR